jgi:lysophospholipase L1-like esterase
VLSFFIVQILFLNSAYSQQNLLQDTNGDGIIKVLSFGDSITYGIGDGGLDNAKPGGYPSRLSTLLGVPVVNAGNPGELLTDASSRYFQALRTTDADLIILLEGTNDSFFKTEISKIRNTYQRFVNGAKIFGKKIALVSLLTPCCDRRDLGQFTDAYTSQIKSIADINQISVFDLDRAWKNTCKDKVECELYNLPEGLHPTSRGYDVVAQTIAAGVLGIDILSPSGAAALEQATGLAAGSVIVKPNPAS